ncbi:MAG: hypothetical protein E6Q59_01480 [Nitrosomonas sp.]|nr:MAG: hypothetical protein E6Q59_01480 [Nitrosomonas sp.]
MLKVGAIDYINFLPFYAAVQERALHPTIDWTLGVPSILNKALRSGELDAAPISSAEYIAHNEKYELLPNFCIGAEGKVMSVCLYVSGQLTNNDVIGLTSQSASSALLVKVLCHYFWKVTPQFITLDSIEELKECNAFLLIGDDSLMNPEVPGYKTIDLAQAWHDATKRPFTFAVFATRKDLAHQSRDSIRQALHQSITWGDQHPDVIERLALEKYPLLSVSVLRQYFNCLRYRFDVSQQEGLKLFAKLANSLPKAPQEEAIYAHENL